MTKMDTQFNHDPYVVVAKKGNFVEYNGAFGGRRHYLVELRNPKNYTVLSAGIKPPSTLFAFDEDIDRGYCAFSALLDDEAYEHVCNSSMVSRVQLAHPFASLRQPTRRPRMSEVTSPAKAQKQNSLVASSALLVVIDDGCPFAHHELLASDGKTTRVSAIWDQDDRPDFQGLWQTSRLVPYGAVVEKCSLDYCINLASTAQTVDQTRCYEIAGYGAVSRLVSHGSAMLGWSAANSVYEGSERAPTILFVQLPRAVAMKSSYSSISRCVLDGIRWALSRRGEATNVVVSVSYDAWLGPHDGSSIFECAVDALLASCAAQNVSLSVVLPMGNNYQAGSHDEIALNKGSGSACLRILPSGETWTFVEFWSKCALGPLQVRIKTPTEEVSLYESRHAPQCTLKDSLAVVANTEMHGENYVTLVRIAPTSAHAAAPAPAGDWWIDLRAEKETDGVVHGYIGRATSGMGKPSRGVQSYFFPKSKLDADGSVNGLACGSRAIAVGGVQAWNAGPSKYSASGNARGGVRTSPDFSAITELTQSNPGLMAIGNIGGSRTRFVGTSAATAKVAAWLVMGSPSDDDSKSIKKIGSTNRVGRRIDNGRNK
jgi:hypothetical protein